MWGQKPGQLNIQKYLFRCFFFYKRFDYILSNDEKILNLVKKYCKKENTKKVEELKDLNDFSKYIEQ